MKNQLASLQSLHHSNPFHSYASLRDFFNLNTLDIFLWSDLIPRKSAKRRKSINFITLKKETMLQKLHQQNHSSYIHLGRLPLQVVTVTVGIITVLSRNSYFLNFTCHSYCEGLQLASQNSWKQPSKISRIDT